MSERRYGVVCGVLILAAGCYRPVTPPNTPSPAPRQRRAKAAVPQPPAPPSEFDLGVKAFQEGRFDEAVRRLLAASSSMQGNNLPYHYLGASYVRLGQYEQGIAALIRANATREDANTYDWLGLAYREKGDFAESSRCYQKALAMVPDQPVFYYGLGVASYWLGWIPESLQAVEMGLKKATSPQEKQPLFELQSWLYAARGMYPEVYGLAGSTLQIGTIIRSHPEGLESVRLMRGFPAAVAGLQPGDVMTSFNGNPLKGMSIDVFVKQVLPRATFGSKARVQFLRAGQLYEADVVAGVPADFAAVAKSATAPRPVAAQAPAGRQMAQERSLRVVRLTVKPPVVAPGSKFLLEIECVVTDPATTARTVPAQLSYAILSGEKIAYRSSPASLELPNGAAAVRTENLTAAKSTGNYRIRVTLRYQGSAVEESAAFSIQ